GFRDGAMQCWTAAVIPGHSRQAPVTQIARRTPRGLAAVAGLCIAHPGVDHSAGSHRQFDVRRLLTWHRIDDKWLITSKGSPPEDALPAAPGVLFRFVSRLS